MTAAYGQAVTRAIVNETLEKIPIGPPVLGTQKRGTIIVGQFAAEAEARRTVREKQRSGKNVAIEAVMLKIEFGPPAIAREGTDRAVGVLHLRRVNLRKVEQKADSPSIAEQLVTAHLIDDRLRPARSD